MRIKFTTMLDSDSKKKLSLIAINNGFEHRNQAIEFLIEEYEKKYGEFKMGNDRRK